MPDSPAPPPTPHAAPQDPPTAGSAPLDPTDPRFVPAVVARVAAVLEECEAKTRPPEVPPFRDTLFTLFARSHGAGLTGEAGPLSADALLRSLADRWGLRAALSAPEAGGTPAETGGDSPSPGPSLGSGHVGKVRLMWSLLRMWMDWEYAWSRWPEFHGE